MRFVKSTITAGALIVACGSAWANVPVIDAALLERRADTSAKKAQIKLLGDEQSKARKGVKCATTTGKQGASSSIQDPRKEAATGQGSSLVQNYAPGAVRPQAGNGSQAGVAAGQMAWDETSAVASSQQATDATIAANKQTYETASGQIGQTSTVMGSFDENSAIRTQNGLTWNNAIQTLNQVVRAFNLVNLAGTSDVSRAAGGVSTPLIAGTGAPRTGAACTAGMTGSGTSADPCRSTACSTTPYGETPDSSCVSRRYVDTNGNVTFYLTQQQVILSTGEAASGLNQYQQ